PSASAPHSLHRIRSVRRKIGLEKRWISRLLYPPQPKLPEAARHRSERVLDEPAIPTRAKEVIKTTGDEDIGPSIAPAYSNRAHTSDKIPLEYFLAPEYLRTRRYKVFFGTSRARRGDNFTNASGGALALGSCTVYVPKTHRFGSIGSTWFTRLIRSIRRQEDDRLRLEESPVLSRADFRDAVAEELHKWSTGAALVVVHGYNVDFQEAARRTAQIGFDLRVDGVTAFFSWPSKGKILPYMY